MRSAHTIALSIAACAAAFALASPSVHAAPVARSRSFMDERAHADFQSRSDDGKARVIATIAQTKSRAERQMLHKVLAHGVGLKKFAQFAAEIRGKGDAWMREQLHLAAQEAGGEGLRQAFANTCVPAVAQAVRAELDPIYALATRKSADALAKVDDKDPYRYNKAIATEQAALFDKIAKGAFPPIARATRGKGIGEHALIRQIGVRLGLPLHSYHAPPRELLTRADGVLDMGLPVVARVTDPEGAGGHVVVILRKQTAGRRAGYLIFDPWKGETQLVARADLASGSFDISGWNVLSDLFLLEPDDA